MFIKKVKENKYLLSILALALILRLYQIFRAESFWWDSYVYVAMAKYMYSAGAMGFWEPFRALGWPFVLGFFWWLGLPILFVADVLDVGLSLLAVYLLYLIGKKLFNEKVGLVAALIFATIPLLLAQTGLLLTEPLALTFGLLGVWFFIHEKNLKNLTLSGVFVGLAFLTKFPQGILLAALFLGILYYNGKNHRKSLNEILILGGSFFIIVLPYFILNHYLYGNFLQPITSGSAIVNTAIWQYNSGYLFYFKELLMKNIALILFYPALIYFVFRKEWKDRNKVLVYIPVLLFLVYFSVFVARKEVRYMIFALPFFALISACFLVSVYMGLKKSSEPVIKKEYFFIIICFIIVVSQVSEFDNKFTQLALGQQEPGLDVFEEFSSLIAEFDTAVVMSSNPKVVLFLDAEIIPTGDIYLAKDVYYWKIDAYSHMIIDDCDYVCEEGDATCAAIKERFLGLIEYDNILLEENSYTYDGKNIKGKKITKSCLVKLYQKPPQ